MRQIGSLPDKSLTERFVDYLRTQDISATFEADDNEWIIWVRDENQLDIAREALQQFEADPNADTYRSVQRQAAELRAAEFKRRRDAKKNVVEMSGTWNAPLSKKAPLVMAMIITCIGLTVLGGGSGNMVDRWLMFADLANPAVSAGDGLALSSAFPVAACLDHTAGWPGAIGKPSRCPSSPKRGDIISRSDRDLGRRP